jgi:FMN phosphatase YigB (HAD superfamily)
MQKVSKNLFFLIICLLNQITFATEFILTPENTIICSDIDEVVTKKTPWAIFNLLYAGLSYDALNIGAYAQAIYKVEKTYTKNADGKRGPLYDQYGDVINGFTFHLLFHGMRDNNLTPYVQLVLDAVESSRCFIKDTKKIYDYLRYKKGYSIVFATNNDHVAYEISANALGEEFTRLADYVFVAQPGNSNAFLARLQDFATQSTIPQIYKDLLYKALTIQPTKNIIHTPGKKPEYEYYHFIEQQLDSHKNIIFIDDQQENVDGFNALQKNNVALRYGIPFKSTQKLIEDFIKLGILSEVQDKEFLEEIRYSGIIDGMLMKIKRMINSLIA